MTPPATTLRAPKSRDFYSKAVCLYPPTVSSPGAKTPSRQECTYTMLAWPLPMFHGSGDSPGFSRSGGGATCVICLPSQQCCASPLCVSRQTDSRAGQGNDECGTDLSYHMYELGSRNTGRHARKRYYSSPLARIASVCVDVLARVGSRSQ